jgi:hypothetical protein
MRQLHGQKEPNEALFLRLETGQSPNSMAVIKGHGGVRGDTTVLVELQWLTTLANMGLGRALGQANYVAGLAG